MMWAKAAQVVNNRALAFGFLLAVFVAVSLLGAGPARADTFTVTSTDDSSLRAAITAANNHSGADTINFASGISTTTLTATGTGDNNNVSGDLDITDDLTINGGSSGVIIEGGPSWNERVIDIIGATTTGASTDVTMTDVTIQKGNATILPGTFDSTRGGGIRLNGGNGTHANGTSLTLQRSTVTNNTAFDGGGIYDSFRSTIVLQDSTVSDNTGSAGVGGIIGGDPLSLTNSTVTGNTGDGLGSGIFIGVGTATIVDSTVSDNNTVSDGGNTNGGGIYISTLGLVTLTGSTVSGNTAQGGTSAGVGKGGGIYRNGGVLTLSNSTVAFNTAFGGGGVFSTDRGSFTFSNTILAKNNASLEPDLSGTFTSEGYNLLGEYSGSGLAPTDIVNPSPGLGPLADNGGPTKTHALLDGSPAIDAGNPATPGSGSPACEATDQRGVTRPQGTACDIGAFELETATLNGPPVANDDPDPEAPNDPNYATDEGSSLTVSAANGVLANDTDPEGDSLTAIKVSDPSNGTLTLNSDGSFTYTPSADFSGTDSFTYKANDGQADSNNAATVTITVNPADTTAPTITSVTPADNATNVARNTSVKATFSEPMDPNTLSGSTVTLLNTKTGASVPAASVMLSPDGKMVTFDPSVAKLAKKTKYEARIKGGSGGAEDLAGNPLATDEVWSFTTGKK